VTNDSKIGTANQDSNLDIKRSSSETQQHPSDEGLGKHGDKVDPENRDAKQVSKLSEIPKSDVEKATELPPKSHKHHD